MKIGTFVGQEHIAIKESEEKEISKRFINAIKAHFPDAKVNYTSKTDDFPTFTITAQNVLPKGKYRVFSNADNHFIRYKDLVYPTGEISVQLFSLMGYDEAETGKFYEWESMGRPKGWKPENDKHSYSLYLHWHGSHKTYRRQYKDGLEIRNHYFYGTELSDLDFESGLKTIADIVKTWVPEK